MGNPALFSLDPVELMIRVPIVLLALTVHEFCHGYFAYRMGDPTAYLQGRLTLNPLKHLDPLGAICLMFAPIGWAKPVPINPLNFHDRRRGILVSTAAGPLSNLAQAIVFALLLRLLLMVGGGPLEVIGDEADPRFRAAFMMGLVAVLINVGLAVFNCLPLFPLDGFHIVMQLLPPERQQRFAETAHFGPFAILGLIIIGHATSVSVLEMLIMPPVDLIFRYVVGIGM